MAAINEIFRRYGPEYLARYGDKMPPNHKRAIRAIMRCRTEENGTLAYFCEQCNKTHEIYRGCGDRHCPTCQNHKTRQWLQKQLERLLPGHHFMITFTVPEGLRSFLRSNQRHGYGALFAASSEAMKTLAADPKYMGGDVPGFFGVLHTWGRTLEYHPHIHYIAPGGALSTQSNRWHPAGNQFYLPVRALSTIYRAKFRDAMIKVGLFTQIPAEVWNQAWNVNCQAVGTAEASLKYLCPYVFKVAISNHRILTFEKGKVTFQYRKQKSNRLRTMELAAMEFIRRFLQHVLPTGFMKVRHYGFLSPTSKIPLEEVRAKIEFASGFELVTPEIMPEPPPKITCRHCGGVLIPYRDVIEPAQGDRLRVALSG